jgi:hypothetical protein
MSCEPNPPGILAQDLVNHIRMQVPTRILLLVISP